MDTHTTLILHLLTGIIQQRQIMIGSTLADEIDLRQEIPDVIAVPGQGFFQYQHTENEQHHYTPVWGVALPNHN